MEVAAPACSLLGITKLVVWKLHWLASHCIKKRVLKARILVSEEKAHTMSLVSCRRPKLEIQLMYMLELK
jgi:hypothetical protein